MDRRDRHGRGMRGPLAPAGVPLARRRSEQFADLVHDAARRVGAHLATDDRSPMTAVEVAVEEVPPAPVDDPDDATRRRDQKQVPLGRAEEAEAGRPARVVVYRRPVELRADSREERAALVQDVVVEHVASLLGLDVEEVDPGPLG